MMVSRMNSLKEDIELYYKNSRLAKETLRKYMYRLNFFMNYLSKQLNVLAADIYLNKIYVIKDANGVLLRYLPIDSDFFDSYFHRLVPLGFYPLRDHHSALNSFFRFLDRNYNFQNPLDTMEFSLKRYYPKRLFSEVLTRSKILKFLNSIVNHSEDLETDLLLFCLLISTGSRISEILNLRYEDIDFENDSYTLVNTKNKSQRIVNLRPGLGATIQIYLTNRNRLKGEYLFQSKNNKNFKRNEVDRLFKHYLELAGLPPLHLHGLRHTFATLMADEQTPILIIQQLLGHKSIKSTKSYINPHYVRNRNVTVYENRLVLDEFKNRLRSIF
jgi:integrase/recombinase XerD